MVAAGAALSLGCTSSFEEIDRRTDRLIRERSTAVGGPVAPSRTDGPRPQPASRKAVSRTDPDTANPTAEELTFGAASPDRDVAGRLADFTKEEVAAPDSGREPLVLTLPDALRVAQRTGEEYLGQEEDYIIAAIALLVERHAWTPRWSDSIRGTVSGSGDDGEFQSAINVVNDLRVTQRLPFGGTVEAGWVWNATEQLREQATGRYRQSSEISVDASIPLLRGAGLVARESLIQSERNLVYRARDFESFRREYLVDIARAFLGLVQSQAQISNEKRRIQSLVYTQNQVQAFVEAGRRKQFEVAITENQVLSALESLASQRDAYIAQLDQFKIRLGIPLETPVVIRSSFFEISEPETSLKESVDNALEYRLDLQNRRDRLDDSRRSLENTRNDLLPDLTASASVGVPTDPDAREGGVAFDPDELNYSAGLNLSLPLDRQTERLNLRSAQIQLQAAERDYRVFEDRLVIEVRSAVRAIELARFRLRLAEERVRLNEMRQKEQLIKADETTPQERVDTESELLDARNARDSAETALRIAILDYLLATAKLRVDRDGQIQPLPGMTVNAIRLFEGITDLEDWHADPPGFPQRRGPAQAPAPLAPPGP